MKFLIDMNLSPLWVSYFADHGVEAVHWPNVGPPTALIPRSFEFAAANSWIIFTPRSRFGIQLAPLRTSGRVSFMFVHKTSYRRPLAMSL
jgi:predicted nuclease of predicted toxin-antitoxin system